MMATISRLFLLFLYLKSNMPTIYVSIKCTLYSLLLAEACIDSFIR
uniref:Uncharacterized protein n=1 Tax=uncultured Thiotrichaceae bacterium TaxID=298394 RepID=A0A6S6SEH8_9GAMM|nr:MAG: Unknown protein [uncultured Thiotrichaceae bacterium]